ADYTQGDQLRVVERGAVGVQKRVTELSALVDRARSLWGHVAGSAAGKGELAKQPSQPLLVVAVVGVAVGVGAVEAGTGDQPGAAACGPGHVDRAHPSGGGRAG